MSNNIVHIFPLWFSWINYPLKFHLWTFSWIIYCLEILNYLFPLCYIACTLIFSRLYFLMFLMKLTFEALFYQLYLSDIFLPCFCLWLVFSDIAYHYFPQFTVLFFIFFLKFFTFPNTFEKISDFGLSTNFVIRVLISILKNPYIYTKRNITKENVRTIFNVFYILKFAIKLPKQEPIKATVVKVRPDQPFGKRGRPQLLTNNESRSMIGNKQ